MCMLIIFAWWCSDVCINQCISFRSMSVWNSGLLVLLEWFFFGYTVQFEMIQFNAITARGTVYNKVFRVHCNWNGIGLAIWLNSTVLHKYFWCNGLDTMPFEVDFLDKLIHTAWSMYSCNVTARGGMKVYGYTRCAVTMFGLECMLHFTLEFVSK